VIDVWVTAGLLSGAKIEAMLHDVPGIGIGEIVAVILVTETEMGVAGFQTYKF